MDEDYALFASVIEAGSLSAAGRRLHLSPAMVSKRLARLEARLGARLIHRTTRRLSTTDVGQVFYEEVVAILAAARAAEARVAGRAGTPSGRLRVSAPTSFGRLHIAPHLKPFLEAHPRIAMELELTDQFSDLLGDRYDLAIRITPSLEPNLTAYELAPNRRVLCAAPSYIEAHGAPKKIDDLAKHQLLAATGQLPWRLEGPGGEAIVTGNSRVRTNSSEVARELAIAGLGIALRSTWDVSRELRDGVLKRVLPTYQGATNVGIYAVHPLTTIVSPSVQAFIQFLTGLYAPVPPWDRALNQKSSRKRSS
ncbi:LysR family transcriptional regulator [Roseiterribacter gracilis]|uniref:LysR family transcriptional regulator n=1 Tax=Roseiterribacter gracilis TaxID=2812848 RepID=A0A8S8X7C8_9PROT|nr:LysR family transcriptional regulator [Rhodospirillales bacterium TMPK1]